MSDVRYQEVLDQVVAILQSGDILDLAKLGNPELKPETRFEDDLNMDSLQALGFTGELEEVFAITLSDELLREVTTIEDAVRLVLSLK
jgi:acyl carrier protein